MQQVEQGGFGQRLLDRKPVAVQGSERGWLDPPEVELLRRGQVREHAERVQPLEGDLTLQNPMPVAEQSLSEVAGTQEIQALLLLD